MTLWAKQNGKQKEQKSQKTLYRMLINEIHS